MIKSKKLLAVGVIAALGLAACGSDDDSADDTGSSSTESAAAGSGFGFFARPFTLPDLPFLN